jgi:circadian clock protein KaiC
MLLRLVDFLKAEHITAFFVALTGGGRERESTDVEISSIIDTWLLVRNIELAGERNRGLYVLKSRGMPHSNQIREFVLTNHGAELLDVYVGPEGVLTGAMRAAQEAREKAATVERKEATGRRNRDLERKRRALKAKMALLQMDIDAVEEESKLLTSQDQGRKVAIARDEANTTRRRGGQTIVDQDADVPSPTAGSKTFSRTQR